jgi:arabinofuranan 3-O-arabinosyltransferase
MPVGVAEVEVLGAHDLVRSWRTASAVSLPCGFGPRLEVDAAVAASTALVALPTDLRDGTGLVARQCGSGTVSLSAGRHRLRVLSTAQVEVTDVVLTPVTPAAGGIPVSSPDVVGWEPDRRDVVVHASPVPRTLELSENANAGWVATVEGHDLVPVVVDGWRQAWVIPAGTAGTVRLEFVPDTAYRRGLAVGLGAAVLLLLLLLLPVRRAGPAPLTARGAGTVLAVAAVVTSVWTVGLLAVPALLVAWWVADRRRAAAPLWAGGLALLAALPQAWWGWPGWLAAPGWAGALGDGLAVTAIGIVALARRRDLRHEVS